MNSRDVLFRASGNGALMTNPKTKADKENGVMSKTAQSFVLETYLKNEFGFEDLVFTPQIMKGHLCEVDAVKLMNKVLPVEGYRSLNTHSKKETLTNEWFSGTPDLMLFLDEIVEDIKCSWNVKTFMNASLSATYYSQIQTYLDLTGLKKGRLVYALVDTPEELIRDEELRLFYKFGANDENPDYINAVNQLQHIHNPSTYIPEQMRIKYYEFERNDRWLDELKRRVEKQARPFYETINLSDIDDSEIESFLDKEF